MEISWAQINLQYLITHLDNNLANSFITVCDQFDLWIYV